MCRRSKATDQQARAWIAEAWDRLAPVFFSAKGGAFLARNLFPPCDQARTAPALNDCLVEKLNLACGHEVSLAARQGETELRRCK